jgi:hypothetical protein
VWRLAALSLVLTAVGLLVLAGPALAQEPAGSVVAAPEFVNAFPELVPVDSTSSSARRPHPSGALGLNGLALAAAIYWLLLGLLALRRTRLRTPREDPAPVAGWVLGCAPPLPR